MINHNAQVWQAAKAVLPHDFGLAIGYGFGPIPIDSQGHVAVTSYWAITVTMKNRLIGYPEIAKTVPIPKAIPGDDVIKDVVIRMVEACRAEASQLINVEDAP